MSCASEAGRSGRADRRRRADGRVGSRRPSGAARRSRGRELPLQPRELGAQPRGGLGTDVPVLLEQREDRLLEPRRQLGPQPARRFRLVAQDRRLRLGARRPAEGAAARGHLVEYEPQREEVGPPVEHLAAHLLGRHVGDGADGDALVGERARGRQRGVGGGAVTGGIGCFVDAREAEVQDLGTVRRQEDVGGLEIAVDHPLAVGGGERVGQRQARVDERRNVHRPERQALVERLAVEQLHHQVRHGRVADVVDRADPGMILRGDRLGLALEPFQRPGRGGFGLQDLDRHHPVEPRVTGPVHLSHATRADPGEYLVGTEPGAGIERHWVAGAADYTRNARRPRAARSARRRTG